MSVCTCVRVSVSVHPPPPWACITSYSCDHQHYILFLTNAGYAPPIHCPCSHTHRTPFPSPLTSQARSPSSDPPGGEITVHVPHNSDVLDMTVRSLSHVRLIAGTLKDLLWDACDGNADKVRVQWRVKKCSAVQCSVCYSGVWVGVGVADYSTVWCAALLRIFDKS